MAKLRFKRTSPTVATATAAATVSSHKVDLVLGSTNSNSNNRLGHKSDSTPNSTEINFARNSDQTSQSSSTPTSKQTALHPESHFSPALAEAQQKYAGSNSYSSRKATRRNMISNPYSCRLDKYYQSSNIANAGCSPGAGGSSSNNTITSNSNETSKKNSSRGAIAAVLRSFGQFAAAATNPSSNTATTTSAITTTNPLVNTTATPTKSTKSTTTVNESATSTKYNDTGSSKGSSKSCALSMASSQPQVSPQPQPPPPPPYWRKELDEFKKQTSINSVDNKEVETEKKTIGDENDQSKSLLTECPLCVSLVDYDSIPTLDACNHKVCADCLQRYITIEINHSRVNIKCPVCSEIMHPNTIKRILDDEKLYLKYETFMLRRVLAADPDARWCPAPDCSYVVLAHGCASCPKLVCQRPSCKTSFCYHCKQEWHPNQTCTSASIQRNRHLFESIGLNIVESIEQSGSDISIINATHINNLESSQENSSTNNATQSNGKQRKSSKSSQQTLELKPEDVKECPVCSSRIIKMNDGSCNHMTCSICETEFCWLCMKEISDLHYFSPSGCTFWGKKPWSRKKKLLWRLGMLVGAPICIIFIAGMAVPAIVIGVPVWAARKLHNILERKQFSRYRKNAIITGGVLLAFAASPFISAFALAVGVPFLLGYVYGVVPLSLCRSSGGCLSASSSVENLSQNHYQSSTAQTLVDTAEKQQAKLSTISTKSRASTAPTEPQLSTTSTCNVTNNDVVSIGTATSHKLGNPSIGETSVYTSNMSLETNSIGRVTSAEREDRESASNAALVGSIISGPVDDGFSTKALAGSISSRESGYTLIPAEVHNNGVQNTRSLVVHTQTDVTNVESALAKTPSITMPKVNTHS